MGAEARFSSTPSPFLPSKIGLLQEPSLDPEVLVHKTVDGVDPLCSSHSVISVGPYLITKAAVSTLTGLTNVCAAILRSALHCHPLEPACWKKKNIHMGKSKSSETEDAAGKE
jgi:hypothetical protein